MTLTEFLLARIAEDEAAAQRAGPVFEREWTSEDVDVTEHIERNGPARVLAECEAKRRIVGVWGTFLSQAPDWATRDAPSLLSMARLTLATLAAIYADHPDYRDEWRP